MDQEAAALSGSLALRGVLATLFGAAAVFWPGITLVTLVYLFSAFVLVNGIVDTVFGIGRLFSGVSALYTRVLTLLLGVLQVGVGVYLLRHPHVTFATFILLIGFTLIVRGVFEIVDGLFENGTMGHKSVMVLLGVLAMAAGIIMLFQPVASGVAFVWILGVYALISGPLLIALAMQIKREATPVVVATSRR